MFVNFRCRMYCIYRIVSIVGASFILTWVYADTATATCPAHPGSLDKMSSTVAAVICDGDDPLFSEYSIWSWIIFHNVTSKHNPSFVLLKLWLQLQILQMTQVHQWSKVHFDISHIPCWNCLIFSKSLTTKCLAWRSFVFLSVSSSKLILGVDTLDLNLGIQINSVKQPTKSNSVGSGHVSHRWSSSFNYHFDHDFVVFKDVRLRFTMGGMCVGVYVIHITQLIAHPSVFYWHVGS